MVYRIADNIFSPLGTDSESVFAAMREGRCATSFHEGKAGGIAPYFASVFDRTMLPEPDGMTQLERCMAESVKIASGQCGVDLSSSRVLFVVSTTKGNISLLRREDGFSHDERLLLYHTADVLRRHFSNPNKPVVISNACISGVSAQIVAGRALDGGRFDYAVVVGADMLSDFIISGFQSFKALSPERALSFDAGRKGLNLGEAVATVIYASDRVMCRHESARLNGYYVAMAGGGIAGDANHISGPSRTGEGLYRALCSIKGEIERHSPGLICCHGTATLYNDEMESIALGRAGLDKVPVNALKAYVGHTLGAAGVLECIISMYQMCYGVILPVPGYRECGVSVPLDVVSSERPFEGDSFIKTISGFGGCNAAVMFTRAESISEVHVDMRQENVATETFEVSLKDGKLSVDGEVKAEFADDANILSAVYRSLGMNYPKFFKMDSLSKAGFVVAEILCGCTSLAPARADSWENTAIILANRHSSLDDDVKYLATISPEEYYPSPSLFVYTLPNIVAGEISIRHKMYGEPTFYICDEYDQAAMSEEAERLLRAGYCSQVIYGWVDWYDSKGEASLHLLKIIENS